MPENFKFGGMRLGIWLLLAAFSGGIVIILYVNQILLLPKYYESVKRRNTINAAIDIREHWSSNYKNFDNYDFFSMSKDKKTFESYVRQIAADYEIFINVQIYQADGSFVTVHGDPPAYSSKIDFSSQISFAEELQTALHSEQGWNLVRLDENGDETDKRDAEYIRVTSVSDVGVPAFVTAMSFSFPSNNTYEIISSQFNRVCIIITFASTIVAFAAAYFVSRPLIIIAKKIPDLTKGKFKVAFGNTTFIEVGILISNLNKVNDEIARTEEIRNSLFANVSHDLRTPLTMIRAYAEKIVDISGDRPEMRNADLKIIIDETQRLEKLVSDILNLSKMQSGVVNLNKTRFNFSKKLLEIVTRFDSLKEQNITLITDITAEIFITADETKIEQVVYNFIHNSVNYSKKDAPNIIKISLYKTQNSCVFSVSDKGIGIKPYKLPYIWDQYFKADKSDNHTRKISGNGLGLSIVKNILERHNFKYGVKSVYGEGSMFWVEIYDNVS